MKKILVVEDNKDNMYLITFILRGNGYEVIEAKNGEQGIKLAIKEKPALIIMDIQLPGIDGFEASRRIRESKEGREIPIISLTSHAQTGDLEKALAAGFAAYIEKPIHAETFMASLEKFLPS